MAASSIRHDLLDDAGRRFFGDRNCKPVGWRCRTVHMEFSTDDCGCAIVLDNPASNFGWLVLGDETAIATAKRFDTRESASPPVLTIQYIPGPRVVPTPRPRPSPAPRPH